MRWSAERATIAAFTLALMLLIAYAVLSYGNVARMNETEGWVAHARVVLDDLNDLLSQLKDVEAGSRGFAATGDESFLRQYTAALPRIKADLERLDNEVNSPENRQALREITPLIAAKISTAEKIVQLRRQHGGDARLLTPPLQHGRELMDRIREVINRVSTREFEALQHRTNASEDIQRRLAFILEIGSVTAILILSLAMLVIMRDLRERQSTERRFRALIQASNDIVLSLNTDGTLDYVSPAVERTLGYKPETVIGKNVFEYLHPDDVAQATESFTNTMSAPGYAVPLQLRLRTAWGDHRVIELLANNLLRDPDVGKVVLNARDITERRDLERRSALQFAITKILASAETLNEATPRILQVICEQTGYDLGELWRVDNEANTLAIVEAWHEVPIADDSKPHFSKGFRLKKGEALPGQVWLQNDVVAIRDIADGPASPRKEQALALKLKSALGVPITFDDEIIAILTFASRTRQMPDEDMIGIFRALGSQIGNFMARKRAEEHAERLQRQTRLILESAGEGIIGIDTRYRITFANNAAERMLGYGSSELVGMEAISTLQPFGLDGSALPREHSPIYAILLEGSTRNITDGTFYRKDGAHFPVQYIGAPIRGDECVTGAVLTFQDVTKRREVERMKDEFVSVVSHELRTPLTSIRGALGLLASGKMGTFPDKAQRMLDIAVNNTDRLVRLINDILDIERIDSGRVAMQKKLINVSDVMEQATDVMRPMAEKNGVRLVATSINADLNADPDRLIQTLTNLLSNAIKFSNHGGKVSLGGHAEDGKLTLYVQDEGRGIPPEKLESIFERFQQVDASDSREKGGTGLGLAICRTIIQQHGGRIWAESKMGIGSKFIIELPLAAQSTHEGPSPDMTGARVLVCDDDIQVCDVVRGMLENRGFRVTTVQSGSDAIEIAKRELPDIILLDLVMPQMNGWQVTDALKHDPRTSKIPVVIFSVLTPSEAKPQSEAIAGWVTKPIEESSFFGTLGRVLGTSNGRTKVLVVEDDPDLARVMTFMLERDGIEARVARSGREAIQLVSEFGPDLLILDLVLPHGDGFTVVQWLRDSGGFRNLPVMVYSAKDLSADERERLTLGRTEFFTKGRVAPDDFEKHILSLITELIPSTSQS